MTSNELIEDYNRLRREKKLSIKSVAEKSEMPYANAYKISQSKTVPRLDTFIRMLSVMGYSLQIIPSAKDSTVKYYEKAAEESKSHSDQWFRYLRKIIDKKGCTLTSEQYQLLLSSESLSLFQRATLKQASISGSVINSRIVRLNEKAKTGMVDEIMRKIHDQG